MTDAIEMLNDQQHVTKTEYTRREADTGDRITVELWHDAKGLQAIFEKSMNAGHSPRGIQEFAKERALAVRETRVDSEVNARAMYPELLEKLKGEADHDTKYEYKRAESE